MTTTLRILPSRCSPSWLYEKSRLWGRSILQLNKSDVVCAFFPKTGSTWVRIFIYSLLKEEANHSEDGFTFDEINFSMPEWGHESFLRPWPFSNSPCLVKIHRPYCWFFRNNRCALFVRDPRDIMVSLWHYARANKEIDFNGSLRDMVYHPELGLRFFMRFYNSWRDRAGIVIQYEQLRNNTHATFRRFVDFIGLDVSDEEVAAAIEASNFTNTRKAQEQSSSEFRDKFEQGFVFARKGASGEGQEQFDDELNDYYRQLRDEFHFDLYRFED